MGSQRRRAVIVPHHATQPSAASHGIPAVRHPQQSRRTRRWPKFDRRVRPLLVVVPDVLAHEVVEVARAHDDEPVEAHQLRHASERRSRAWDRNCLIRGIESRIVLRELHAEARHRLPNCIDDCYSN